MINKLTLVAQSDINLYIFMTKIRTLKLSRILLSLFLSKYKIFWQFVLYLKTEVVPKFGVKCAPCFEEPTRELGQITEVKIRSEDPTEAEASGTLNKPIEFSP